MRVFITGGTGLIGRHLARKLVERGDHPVILTRNADHYRRDPSIRGWELISGDPTSVGRWQEAIDGCDAVVNLAGHNLFVDRWNTQVKRRIRDSRVYGTERVVDAIARARQAPKVLVQGSAIGYYGNQGETDLTESSPSGSDYMAVVCREWEEAATRVESLGTRLAVIRTGVVLAPGAGALGVMTPIFKWVPFGAAPVGSGGSALTPSTGPQWLSWIHLEDLANMFLFALDHAEASGPLNGTAPHPARNSEFSRALARALWRPYVPLGPPEALLKLILGEVADMVTQGQKVLPEKALALGFTFRYPEVAEALKAIFARPPRVVQAREQVATAHHH